MPAEKIQQAVEAKKLWLFEKMNHEQKYPSKRQRKEFVSSEALLYLGRHYRLEVTDADEPGVQFQAGFFISRQSQPQAAKLFRQWYLDRAWERIPARAKYFAQAMGVRFHRLLISDLKVRWGSCTPNSNLNFNWRIIKAPTVVIDYLIVHELAHLIEPNHTPWFWNVVSVQVPRAAWAKGWLRDHGDLLEVDF
jgi:predicted metal-dependent hydrolase